MPYTRKQIAYFEANKGKKPGITSKMVAEAEASVRGGNYLPAKRSSKSHPAKRKGR